MPISETSPMNAACRTARDRMNKTAKTLPDSVLWPMMDILIVILQQRWPCLGDPFTLSGVDRMLFENALGLTAAARLNPGQVKGTATGSLTGVKINNKQFDYAAPAQPKTLEQGWADEAWESLRLVSCIAATLATNATAFNVFTAAGPRSQQEAAGIFISLNPLYNCLLDERLSPEVIDPLIGQV